MELIEGNDFKFLKLVAVEFNIEKNSFRAFFSYKNSSKPILAVVINYYKCRNNVWKSFVSLQEPYNYMIAIQTYNKLQSKLQKIANSFLEQYNKGAEIEEEPNHFISKQRF